MEASFAFIPLIFVFPIAGLLVNIFFGKYLGPKGPGILASLMAGLSFVTAVAAWATLAANGYHAVEVTLWQWIATGPLVPGGPQFDVELGILVDTLSVTMCLAVTGVGALIHVYAIGYMAGDPRVPRFFVFMNLFLASMLVLVLGNSYLVMFIGWELVGLCSYLLIGFWFDKGKDGIGNAIAAKKAFVVNRVGDFGFILGLFLIWTIFGTLNYNQLFAMLPGEAEGAEHLARALAHTTPEVAPAIFTAIGLLLLVGATGKSAQIPLFVWLPDAMAGPTPVSALIHAATMVTAGIYMIARSHPIYNLTPDAQSVVALIGAATALVAGTIAVAQFDIKRVLAFSTISQLGFMIAAVGMGAYVAGMFHLVTHAFFKALLFLGAGAIIHAAGTRDMREMGGLAKSMPFVAVVFSIGALALAGIPPIWNGFWSKEMILEAGELQHNLQWAYYLMVIGAGITALYTCRMVWMVFFGEPRGKGHPHDAPTAMRVSLAVLAVGTVTSWLLVGQFGDMLKAALAKFEPEIAAEILPGFESLAHVIQAPGTLLALAVIAVGILIWLLRSLFGPLVYGMGWLAKIAADSFGFEWLNDQIVHVTQDSAEGLRFTQTGLLNWNVFGIVAGLVAVLAIVLLGA